MKLSWYSGPLIVKMDSLSGSERESCIELTLEDSIDYRLINEDVLS
jgi:hypothetical protein